MQPSVASGGQPQMPENIPHEHDEFDECVQALHAVHAFLHDELGEADADLIRHHLHACERCLESFEIEATIKEMLRRSNSPKTAPSALEAKIIALRAARS